MVPICLLCLLKPRSTSAFCLVPETFRKKEICKLFHPYGLFFLVAVSLPRLQYFCASRHCKLVAILPSLFQSLGESAASFWVSSSCFFSFSTSAFSWSALSKTSCSASIFIFVSWSLHCIFWWILLFLRFKHLCISFESLIKHDMQTIVFLGVLKPARNPFVYCFLLLLSTFPCFFFVLH